MRHIRLIFLGLLVLCYLEGKSQNDFLRVSGIVQDSLTHLPVPYAAIQIHSSKKGTSSDESGEFSLLCSIGDTLQVSRVGYLSKSLVITTGSTNLLISLRENSQMLKPITIYGSFLPQGSKQWNQAITIPKPFRNPAGPGSGYAVETFGPGYVFNGVFSRFSKSEREKRKLKKEKANAADTEAYRNTITSPEVKKFFLKTFSLSEEEFSKKIEQFNIEYPDAASLKSEDEIMQMLVNFFAQKEK